MLALILLFLVSRPMTYANAAYHVAVQATGNTITLATVTAEAGSSGTFALLLDNSDAVASGQLRFTYAAALGLTITGVQVTDRTTGFTSIGSAYATGNAALLGYQVLFYNLSNLTIAPGTGAILTFAYTTTADASGSTALSFTQTILASASAQSLPVTPINGSFTILVPSTATATNTPTNTPVSPTATATDTPTNTPVSPTATPTDTPTDTPMPPIDTATATATNTSVPPTETATETATETPTNTPVPPTATPTNTPVPNNNLVYFSSSRNGRVDRLSYQDEDILLYDRTTNRWQLYFDGSDVRVGNADLDAFDLLADGSILMSFDVAIRFPNLGQVDDSDIVKFIPSQLGSTTRGTFELFFDGSAVDLTTGGEDIDAIVYRDDGALLISVYGSAKVGEVRGHDEDLLRFTPTALGTATAGSWDLYFDGSAVELTNDSEDVGAATLDAGGNLYLATKGNYSAVSLTSIQGDDDDLFGCTLSATGENVTSCTFFAFFNGDLVRFNRPIDGVSLKSSNPATLFEISSSSESDDGEQFEVVPDEPVTDDAEFNIYDQLQTDETPLVDVEIYLPLISR